MANNSPKVRLITAIFISLILGVATLASWQIVRQHELDGAQVAFENLVDEFALTIAARLARNQVVLSQLAATIELLDGDIDPSTWNDLVVGADLPGQLPATQGFGFSRFIAPNDLAEHNAWLRQQYGPEFRVYPESDRPVYSSIDMLEPLDWRNERAIGYDMFSEARRQIAMLEAINHFTVSLSNPVILVQETESDIQNGFLLYAAAYRNRAGTDASSASGELLENVIGFAYSVVRGQDFVDELVSDNVAAMMRFRLVDSELSGEEGVIGRIESPDAEPASLPTFQHVADISLGFRNWRLEAESLPAFSAAEISSAADVVAILGTVITALVSLAGFNLYGQGRRLQLRANELSREVNEKAHRLSVAQQADQFGTWELNLETRHVSWDANMAAIYGIPLSRFGSTYEAWTEYVLPADLASLETVFWNAVKTGTPFETSFRIRRADGALRHIQTRAAILQNERGEPTHAIGINRDITNDVELLERAQLAANVFAYANEGILITDANQRIVDVNQTFSQITGYAREEILGKKPSVLRSGVHSPNFYRSMWKKISTDGYWTGEICNRRRSGEEYYELLHISEIRNGSGEVVSYIGIFSDITLLKQHQDRVDHMAHHDALTDLPNRNMLHAIIENQLARARRADHAHLAFMYIDLDYFKEVNDRFGHTIGDKILVQVAKRLRTAFPSENIVARFGGDEFVAVMQLNDGTSIEPVAIQVLDSLSEPFQIESIFEPIEISASIGISFYPEDETNADALIRQADIAMYNAKLKGRNQFVFFDSEQDRSTLVREQKLREVAQALERGQFELYFQPKVRLSDETAIGFEALIRWNHPTRGLVSPKEFIEITETDELCVDLGEWVIRQALDTLQSCRETNPDCQISVNVSGRHLVHERFIPFIKQMVEEHGRSHLEHLELEVLESFSLGDIEAATQIMRQCAELGVRFAIDDFGTGYSSLAYLRALPAQTLKIDQSFVMGMLENEYDRSIVEAVIGVGKAFHKQIVAEGVETPETEAALKALGCEMAQGYLYAKPMPYPEAVRWLETGCKPA